ncbi:MAG: hypothetical protein ACRCTE_00740 [Cellulosilyticaceae bacterium]
MGLTLEEMFRNIGLCSDESEEEFVSTEEMLRGLTAATTTEGNKASKNSKSVFKQYIEYGRAEALMDTVLLATQYSEYDMGQYKAKLLSECNLIEVYKECPIEMLIYGAKGIPATYHNTIIDVLRNFGQKGNQRVEAYRHILVNWSWEECLSIVLKSIMELRVEGLETEIYEIFEKNNGLRELAAKALIETDGKQYFASIVNFLASRDNERVEERNEFADIMRYMGNKHPLGSRIVYDMYVQGRYRSKAMNLMIIGMRDNMSQDILADIKRKMLDTSQPPFMFDKLIRILDGTKNGNPLVMDVLAEVTEGGKASPETCKDNMDKLMAIARDTGRIARDRTNAITYIGKLDHPGVDVALEQFKREDDQLCIAATAAAIERGNKADFKQLFKYVIQEETINNSELITDAMHQIKRLKGLRKDAEHKKMIEETLEDLVKNLLQPGRIKSPNIEERIVQIYATGIPTENLGEIFLDKMHTTTHANTQMILLEFFENHMGRFKQGLRERSIEEIIRLSKEPYIGVQAMKVLGRINGEDSGQAPTLN